MIDAKAQEYDDLLGEAIARLAEVNLGAEIDFSSGLAMTISSTVGRRQYQVQVKPRVSPSSAAATRAIGRRTLVITLHVSDAVGEISRRQNIQYVDAAGNMYLRWPGLRIDVRGRKNPAQSQQQCAQRQCVRSSQVA